jgi:AcrR family transcriptional regulator
MAKAGTAKRSYESPLREERAKQTRDAVFEAAGRLFTTRGWAATGVRDIAREAGVAIETVYSHCASKTELLRQVIDIAVVGDEQAVPLAERPEFAALGEGTRDERVAKAAALLTEVHVRTAPFAKVVREAAYSDPAMAQELEDTRKRQRSDLDRAIRLMLGRKLAAHELDGVTAVVSVEGYLLLTEFNGWSAKQYQQWIASIIDRLLPSS